MRLGVVSDIHRQWRALDAALAAIGQIDGLLCLGDSIDQSRFCNETVAKLRSCSAQVVLGNHEDAFFARGAGAGQAIDPELAEWLATRPRQLEMTLAGRRLMLVHSTPWRSGHAYVVPSSRDFRRFGEVDADIVLYGHTHYPLVTRVGAVLVVNPGSVGEGRPTTNGFVRSCAVLDLAVPRAEILDLD